MDTEKKVIELSRNMSFFDKEVHATSNYKDDLDYDSLECVELVMEIEEEFDVEIPDEDAEKVETVQDMIDLVNRLKGE